MAAFEWRSTTLKYFTFLIKGNSPPVSSAVLEFNECVTDIKQMMPIYATEWSPSRGAKYVKNCIANHDERENRFFVTSIFENAAAKHNKIDYLPSRTAIKRSPCSEIQYHYFKIKCMGLKSIFFNVKKCYFVKNILNCFQKFLMDVYKIQTCVLF